MVSGGNVMKQTRNVPQQSLKDLKRLYNGCIQKCTIALRGIFGVISLKQRIGLL